MRTKDSVLALLERERGRSVSGERIAAHLSVSRNAVWKAIGELKKDGYRIAAVTNKGYSLLTDNDILSAQGISLHLSKTEAADRIFLYDSLESTNKTAIEMALKGAKHGTTVIANEQTSGKGRYGRVFHSLPGRGVYMSVILHPHRLRFSAPALATVFAAVSVCEAVEAISGKRPRIKWVNDIYLDEKKICGILTEAVSDFESGGIQWIVVGIGVNFSAGEDAFPEALRAKAGSVFPDGHAPTTRNHLTAEIINRMTGFERELDEASIILRYKERLMMLGKEIAVSQSGESYFATAVDIDASGRLVVRKDTGELCKLSSGEISIQGEHGG